MKYKLWNTKYKTNLYGSIQNRKYRIHIIETYTDHSFENIKYKIENIEEIFMEAYTDNFFENIKYQKENTE